MNSDNKDFNPTVTISKRGENLGTFAVFRDRFPAGCSSSHCRINTYSHSLNLGPKSVSVQ